MGNIASLGIVALIAVVAVAVVSIWIPWYTAIGLVVAILVILGFVTASMRQTIKDHPALPKRAMKWPF